MEYTKTVWKDLPDTSTPITADRLNNLENGVEYLFENGIGGGDNLPVGVEMDFDGTSQDIPTGWQEITNSVQILWTNSNPTSDFSSQTITLSSSDYDFLEIFFCSNVQSINKTFEIRKTIKNYDVTLSVVVQNANTYRIVRFTDATHLAVESGYSGTDVQDRRCVPLYVIGYKTGIFN